MLFYVVIGAVKLLKILYYASALGGRWDSSIGGWNAVDADDDAARHRLFDIDDEELQDLDGHALLARLMERSRRHVQWVDPLRRILNINLVDSRQPLVPVDEFVNEPLSEIVEMDKDFINYRAALDGEQAFSFMLHPFVLTPTVKHVAMYFDNRIRMMNERRAAMLQGLMGEHIGTPHLKLSVRRDHLIDDALVNVSKAVLFKAYVFFTNFLLFANISVFLTQGIFFLNGKRAKSPNWPHLKKTDENF